MKYFFALLLFTISFTANAFAQKKSPTITAIRAAFAAINKDSSYIKVVLENEDFLDEMPDGGGKLTGFYKGKEIKKILTWIGLSNGVQIYEYYFKDGKLIFVYEERSSFAYNEKTSELDYTHKEKNFEGRYYFDNGALIDYITTGHNRFEDDTLDIEKTLLDEANDYVKKLQKAK